MGMRAATFPQANKAAPESFSRDLLNEVVTSRPCKTKESRGMRILEMQPDTRTYLG
jgi:hypothetical protein